MGKHKEANAQSFDKAEVFNSMRKRNLKVVLYKNKYLLNDRQNTKPDLIKELLCEERKSLNLHEEDRDSYNLYSEDEENFAKETISELLEQKKSYLFTNHSESSSTEPPPKILRANRKWRKRQKQQKQENVIFPVIPKNKMDNFFSLLSTKPTISDYDKKLKQCLARDNTSDKSFWNSPSCIIKAIQDSILQRKWNNLPQLLLMLIHFRSGIYKPIIRHYCQIVAELHPAVQENGLKDQFKALHQVHRKSMKM